MDGRKIPEQLENPIDNFFIEIATILNPYFYTLGFNPNGITTLSLIFGLLTCGFYRYNYYILASILLIVSYFFDIMDGNFARKYDMQSKFGDYYDHIKDITVLFILSILIITNNKIPLYFKLLGLFIGLLFLICTVVHLGCIEKYVMKKKKDSNIQSSQCLLIFSELSKLKNIKILRHFACGTANIYLSLFILLHILYV
tara:strand:- start:2597 stop:3193 length:597 start_codon:yes stop_codon:yes gene_type:complete